MNQQDRPILVIGSAHSDIFADYEPYQEDQIDKIGEFTYGIGGTGYNIAINLGQHDIPVALYTFLKKDSLSTEMIINKLEKNGVFTDLVQCEEYIPESGFVSMRMDGDMRSAVTSCGISEADFNKKRLFKVIKRAKFVVVDCNLNVDQLNIITNLAYKLNTRIAVAGVSDTKAPRIKRVSGSITLASVNHNEACAIADCDSDELEDNDLRRICIDQGIDTLAVTDGENGYYVADSNAVKKYSISVNDIVSTSGAGDAFLAGICHHIHENHAINIEDARDHIYRHVSAVLKSEGATVNATTRDEAEKSGDHINDSIENMTDII